MKKWRRRKSELRFLKVLMKEMMLSSRNSPVMLMESRTIRGRGGGAVIPQ